MSIDTYKNIYVGIFRLERLEWKIYENLNNMAAKRKQFTDSKHKSHINA